jgi:hypothetical protein
MIVILEPFFWGMRIKRPDRVDPFQIPPFVNFLQGEEPFRVFGLDGILYPNISTAYHVADVRWLNALVPQRAFDFSSRFIQPNEIHTVRLTGTALPISDKMFTLLNVRYVFQKNSFIKGTNHCVLNTDNQPYFGEATLNHLIFEQNQDKRNVFPEFPLQINGVTRLSMFAEAPQHFDIDLFIPEAISKLDFSIGLHPETFFPQYGDGVIFKIIVLEQDRKVEVFSKYIDPKNNPCDRRWFDESIPLGNWSGQQVILRFTTTAGPSKNTDQDWAYWGDIRLTNQTGSDSDMEQIADVPYSLAYQDPNVLIYQNKNVFPRAFIVYRVKNVHSSESALDLLSDISLNLRQVGVVENLPVSLENRINSNDLDIRSTDGRVELIRSGELEIQVHANAPGLLVVSEQYYPGWQAYVDGESTPIYAVNSTLRGVFLEAGDHMVEFKYRPLSFIIGEIMSAVTC